MPAEPKSAIAIRFASVDDVPLILAFVRDLAEYERRADHVVATEEDLRRTLFGDRPAAEVLFAEIGAEAVGFALFFGTYSTFVGKPGFYLEDLYVQPEYRGRGVGQRLLKELAVLAVERGCARIDWSVLDWNESAITFYQQLGALPQGEWQTYRLTGDALEKLARRTIS